MISPRLQSLPGTHTPDLTYVKQGQEGAKFHVSRIRDKRPASLVIDDEIGAVMKNYDFLTLAQVRMARVAFCRYMADRHGVCFRYKQACAFFPSALVV